jgi:hypothetical protein
MCDATDEGCIPAGCTPGTDVSYVEGCVLGRLGIRRDTSAVGGRRLQIAADDLVVDFDVLVDAGAAGGDAAAVDLATTIMATLADTSDPMVIEIGGQPATSEPPVVNTQAVDLVVEDVAEEAKTAAAAVGAHCKENVDFSGVATVVAGSCTVRLGSHGARVLHHALSFRGGIPSGSSGLRALFSTAHPPTVVIHRRGPQACVEATPKGCSHATCAAGHHNFDAGACRKVRKTPSWPPEVGPTSAFCSCIPAGMHGPTCIFWANLTPLSLKIPAPAAPAPAPAPAAEEGDKKILGLSTTVFAIVVVVVLLLVVVVVVVLLKMKNNKGVEGGARGASGTSENPVARDQAAAQAQQWGQQQGQSPRRLAIRTPEEPSSGPREPSHCRVHCREPITAENVSWTRITSVGPTIIARAGRPSRSTRGTSSNPSPPPRRRPTGPRPRTRGPAGRCACAPRARRARQHVAGKPWRFRPCSLRMHPYDCA